MYTNTGIQPLSAEINGRCSSLPPSNPTYCNGVSAKHRANGSQQMSQNGADVSYEIAIDMGNYSVNKAQNCSKPFHTPNRSRLSTEQNNISLSNNSSQTDDSVQSSAPFSPSELATSSATTCSGPPNSDSGSGSGTASRDELLNVMTEDLVDWFARMYPNLTHDLDADTFYDRIADGVLLCHHAVELHKQLSAKCSLVYEGDRAILEGLRVGGVQAVMPKYRPSYQSRGLRGNAATSGFVSRDNVANFLIWCRQLGMPDSVLFESEDVVCRRNPRNVAVCLLELARIGGLVGLSVPELILLEKEIDEELAKTCVTNAPTPKTETNASSPEGKKVLIVRDISTDPAAIMTAEKAMNIPDIPSSDSAVECNLSGPTQRSNRATDLRRKKSLHTDLERSCRDKKKEEVKTKPEVKRPPVDMRSLDEIVRELLSQCTCKQTFPVNRIGEGRYLFGDKCTQIFVRILRNHVMVRVGGGWDTLGHFLSKHDECRKANPSNQKIANHSESLLGNRTSSIDSSNPDEMSDFTESSEKHHGNSRRISPIGGRVLLNNSKKSAPPEPKPSNQRTPSNCSKNCSLCLTTTQCNESNGCCAAFEAAHQQDKQTQIANGIVQPDELSTPQQRSIDSTDKKQGRPNANVTQNLPKIISVSEPSSPIKIHLKAAKNIPKVENHSPQGKSIPEGKSSFQRSKSSTNLTPHMTAASRIPPSDQHRIPSPSSLNDTFSKSVTNLTHVPLWQSNSKSPEVTRSRHPTVRRKSMVPLSSSMKRTQMTGTSTHNVSCGEPWWSTSDQRGDDKDCTSYVKVGYQQPDTIKRTQKRTTRSTSLIPKPVQCDAFGRASCHTCTDRKISDL